MTQDEFVAATIEDARKAWGLDEQWKFTWEYRTDKKEYCEIDPTYFHEKRALIKLDPGIDNPERLRRDIYHEVGHAVVFPIWLAASDWADHQIKGKKMRAIWDEMVNTSENAVIDHIVCQVLKI